MFLSNGTSSIKRPEFVFGFRLSVQQAGRFTAYCVAFGPVVKHRLPKGYSKECFATLHHDCDRAELTASSRRADPAI